MGHRVSVIASSSQMLHRFTELKRKNLLIFYTLPLFLPIIQKGLQHTDERTLLGWQHLLDFQKSLMEYLNKRHIMNLTS